MPLTFQHVLPDVVQRVYWAAESNMCASVAWHPFSQSGAQTEDLLCNAVSNTYIDLDGLLAVGVYCRLCTLTALGSRDGAAELISGT